MRIFGLEITRNRREPNLTNWARAPISQVNRTVRSDYENGFAPVNAIVDEIIRRNLRFEANEKPYSDNITEALKRPNDRMGFTEFITVLASGFLVLPEMNLLVWRRDKAGKYHAGLLPATKPKEIAGFTILPRGSHSYREGRDVFKVSTPHGIEEYGRESVLTLKYSLLPDDLQTGVSAGSASKIESEIQDLLNQQQKAFFVNGAQPSLIVTITARSHEEFMAMRNSYEQNNRGAANSGGVVYQKVISDGQVGGETGISVEVVGSQNNTLAINEINEYTSKRINANYGVSPIIFGDSTTTTFQNQQLANKKFYTKVDAVMRRLFDNIHGEIERVAGTQEWEFAWDEPSLEIVEEVKARAEANRTNVDSLIRLVNSGATVEQAIKALGLSEEWADLVLEKELPYTIFSENKADTRVRERVPAAQERIRQALEDMATAHFARSEHGINAIQDLSDEQYLTIIITALNEIAERGGVTAARQLAQQIEAEVSTEYAPSRQLIAKIQARANMVMNNYAEFLDEFIASTPTREAFKVALASGILGSRIESIATMETKTAFQHAQLENAIEIGRTHNTVVRKVWRATGSAPCEFCRAIDGTQAGIENSFIPSGQIQAEDGSTIILDETYSDGTTPDAHSRCQCTFEFIAERN